MKPESVILGLLVAITSPVVLADEERKDPGVGENANCVKCIDIVDQARHFNPDKIVWKSDKPVCEVFSEDGSCHQDDESAEVESDTR